MRAERRDRIGRTVRPNVCVRNGVATRALRWDTLLVGRVLLGVGIAGWLAGLGVLLLEAVSSDLDKGGNLIGVSLGLAAVASALGFLGRRRIRLAHEAMVIGLSALGAWFLLLVDALGRDTP